MCFAPQRRALFRHLKSQKWSEPGVLCTFWLGNVLRATTACNFSCLIWPHGSTPAALRAYFSTLRSHKSLVKHSESQLSYLFAHLHLLSSHSFSSLIVSLLLFSSLTLPPLLFQLSILSEGSRPNFLRSKPLFIGDFPLLRLPFWVPELVHFEPSGANHQKPVQHRPFIHYWLNHQLRVGQLLLVIRNEKS